MTTAKRYDNDYPSVTQILGVLRKIGLEMWYKVNTAAFCDAESNKGKEVGTQLHGVIQAIIEGITPTITTSYDAEVKTAIQSFLLFKKENPHFKLQRAEMKLISHKYGYNGTLDCLATDTELVIFDWKTGKAKDKPKPPVYDEHIVQASGYVKAYNEVHDTDIKRAFIVVLAKDKIAYNLKEISPSLVETAFNGIFLPALTIFNAQKIIKGELK